MINDIMHFIYNGNDVRTITIDNNPWFVAQDICTVLITNTSNLSKVLDTDERDTYIVRTPGGNQRMVIINEPGLYSLILRSRKPEAKKFKRWITHEVLPTIRKTQGTYMTDDALVKALRDPDHMIGLFQHMKKLKQERDQEAVRADEAVRTKAWINNKKVASANGTL